VSVKKKTVQKRKKIGRQKLKREWDEGNPGEATSLIVLCQEKGRADKLVRGDL